MTTQTEKQLVESKTSFGTAVRQPSCAADCGMEEAFDKGFLREPAHAMPVRAGEVPARPSFFGE